MFILLIRRLLNDSVDSSAYRNQATGSIQQRLRDAQSALDRERFERKQSKVSGANLEFRMSVMPYSEMSYANLFQDNYLSRIQKLESELAEIVQQLTEEKSMCAQIGLFRVCVITLLFSSEMQANGGAAKIGQIQPGSE